jgi:hypothetical protein
MLMSGEDAKNRSIPLPDGYTWSDIAWVVGGFGRKALFVDNNGYIITSAGGPGNNQFNFLTGNWTDYHPGEADKPYDCGACHTTNYVASGNQGGLPGMQGTFDAGGVQCEQCHGNNGGEDHMTGPQRIDRSAEACGACHHKAAAPGETNAIAAADGFIVNGSQYNELKASPHHNVDCVTCHDPHKRSEYSISESFTCEGCHPVIATTYQDNVMADYGVTCTDCHMPPASLSGEPLGPYQGDIKTHIFAINTDPDASLFTAGGDFVALDGEGEAGVTLDFACKRCHETTEMDELARFARNFHGVEQDEQQQLLPELHYTGITPGNSGHYWGGLARDGEGFLIDVSYRPNGRILIVVSFYTYAPDGTQTWLVGAKTIDPGQNTAIINIAIPEGAMWGPDFNPADLPTPRQAWGTMELIMDTCGTASFVATPNAEMISAGFVEYGYDLTRDISISGIACPRMMNDPAILTP